MVRNLFFINFFLIMLFCSKPAWAMLEQTRSDLLVLEDALQNKVSAQGNSTSILTPMLVATPRHLWEESRSDFAPAIWDIYKKIWPNAGDLIQCQDCNMQRLHAAKQHTITIDSGDLSTADLLAFASDPRYQGVKSVVFTNETASGVEVKILRLSDGAVLFQCLADGRTNLNLAKPQMGLVKEMERRQRGESLAYISIDMGFYPSGLFHISFLEQWGSLNQHITGVTLSLINPLLAIGATYRYMMPFNRRITVSGQVFFPLQAALSSGSASSNLAANVGIQMAFSSTFGGFVSLGTSGGVSAGISMYNPVFFPFML